MDAARSAEIALLCQYCGSETRADIVKVALWDEEELVVVDGVPARVCSECFEQFYDDSVRFYLDKLRGLRFPDEMVRRKLEVPIFSFEDLKEKV